MFVRQDEAVQERDAIFDAQALVELLPSAPAWSGWNAPPGSRP